MRKKLIIIGAGGHGKVVANVAIEMNKWQSVKFLDDDESIKLAMEFDVIGGVSEAFLYKNEADFFVAIGSNPTREKIQGELAKEGLNIISLIHPSAIIGKDVKIGKGTVIMAGVIVNCCSTIGKGCIINTGAIIEHDNKIEDYVHISPGTSLAGEVSVGKSSWIGIGSVVSNKINIAKETMVGAGSVVIDNIYHKGVYVGVPAKKI